MLSCAAPPRPCIPLINRWKELWVHFNAEGKLWADARAPRQSRKFRHDNCSFSCSCTVPSAPQKRRPHSTDSRVDWATVMSGSGGRILKPALHPRSRMPIVRRSAMTPTCRGCLFPPWCPAIYPSRAQTRRIKDRRLQSAGFSRAVPGRTFRTRHWARRILQ